jgi:hypothetical protein
MTFKTWIPAHTFDWFTGEDMEIHVDAEYSEGRVRTGDVRVLYRGSVDVTRAMAPPELSALASLAAEQLMKEKAGA